MGHSSCLLGTPSVLVRAGWPAGRSGSVPGGVPRSGLGEERGRIAQVGGVASLGEGGQDRLQQLPRPVWWAVAAGGLARDELGERGGRLALALWVVAPGVVLYLATSADAVFAVVLGAAVLAAHRGLVRHSAVWTVAGGVLLGASSMLTYAAVLLLVFFGVRAVGLLGGERGWVLRWAAGTSTVVVALAGGLWLATGYDVPATVLAVHAAYQAAPGSAGRSLVHWLPGDLLAFGGMLGVPLLAALAARSAAVVRERAWASVDAAALATLLAAASWGFTKGEVERIFQFLVPLVLVPVVRQLLAWRVRAPVVVGLLVGQTLLVQVLFATRW